MSTTQETSVTSSQDLCTAVEVSKKVGKIIGETKADCIGGKLTIEELFPWIIEFKKKCRCLIAQPNIVALIKLMKFYARNVSINVNECYTKPYRAAKLKDSISETLLFFLFYFRELVEVCDKNSYLDKMSDLLAMYLDMELKASRRGKEHHSKISARLTSCLYVYLENSSEHILDTFIKAKFINRNYHDILDPVLTKISKTLPVSPNCDTMYVRYLLIYRLWKKVNNDAAIKNQINSTAILHLGPPPSSPTPFLAKYVLPKVPKSQANSTKFLLLHKFDIEKSCRLFIQYCKENREDEEQGDLDKPNFVTNTVNSDSLETLGGTGMCRDTNNVDNLIDNVNILPEAERRQQIQSKINNNKNNSLSEKVEKSITKQEPGEISPLKPIRSAKILPRLKTKKNGDILFIDLTADEITEKIIKKKKQRKLHWLTEVKKKLNTKNIKAAEKKKRAQSIAENVTDDFILPGLVDSTSTGSLIDATIPKPTIFSNADTAGKFLSKANTQEPENCVTSNFAENEFAEKQSTCDVTTTVTESILIASSNADQIAGDSVPELQPKINPTANSDNKTNHCHTTSKQEEIRSKKSQTWTVSELSNALSHICESYDSDNSNLDATSNEKADSKQNNNDEITKIGETDAVKNENMVPDECVKVKEIMEEDKESEKPRSEALRCSSESSDVAVIFTRRASDVDIVDLDEYIEDDKTQIEKIEEGVCSSTGFADLGQNSESKTIVMNNEVKDLTLRTDKLKLTNSWETLSEQKRKRSKNCNVKEESSNDGKTSKFIDFKKRNEPKFDEQIEDSQSIETVNRKKMLSIEVDEQRENLLDATELETKKDNLEKLSPSKFIENDIRKSCDYESSKGKESDGVKLTLSNDIEIVENKASSIIEEYVTENNSIPKINEILICTKNCESNIQEPQYIENIDGLSLLASVSQHVSHLEEYSDKSLSKPKIIINGQVPQTNSTQLNNQMMVEIDNVAQEEVVETDGSYEVLLDLNVGASGEIITEIQSNDNNLTETELKTEIYERGSPKIAENDSTDVVPLILETTVDLNSSRLHNNLISVENVTQMIKESTNVIVNGETVVLFQKSPNSNLYIINKAADGTMECLADDKKPNSGKCVERNSTHMRDIINHIPINLSEKNPELKDAGKIHRSSNKNRKLDNAAKKYEKQLKPIREKLLQQDEYIKKEIVVADNYDESFRQRFTDTPGSVTEIEPVKKSPPPVIRLTDTPVDVKMMANHQEVYKESSAINMATTSGRFNRDVRSRKEKGEEGTSIENLTFKQNIKQEFGNCTNNLPRQIKSNSLQVPRQNYANINTPGLQFPINSIHSSKIPHVYGTITNPNNLFNVEHEPCNYISCNLKMNSPQSYQSIQQSVTNCQLSRCDCIKCAYGANCPQYVQRPSATAAANLSYPQTNSSYFISNDNSSGKLCDSKERELKLNEAALAKLHDDELLHNIEQSIIDSKKLNEVNVKTVPNEIKFKPEFENKLPLKKRLKAHAMLSLSYDQATSIKIEKVENYPGTPMMSIAALESRNLSQATSPIYEDKPTLPSTGLELSPRVKDDSISNHHTTEMIRRDYLKDTSLTSIGNCGNVDERGRKLDHQRRQTNSHVNIMGSGCQRSFKTPAQRKEVLPISSTMSLKRAATTVANNPKSPKKGKKTKVIGNCRQTRSSKRNIPKVDYSYDGVIDAEPKLNNLSEYKRKRKKTSR